MDADHATRVQLTARLRTAQEAFNAALFAATPDHATRVQLTARLRTAQEAFNAALFAATQAGLRVELAGNAVEGTSLRIYEEL
jgi:hypothetical protein